MEPPTTDQFQGALQTHLFICSYDFELSSNYLETYMLVNYTEFLSWWRFHVNVILNIQLNKEANKSVLG